jgi:hypothetical protein
MQVEKHLLLGLWGRRHLWLATVLLLTLVIYAAGCTKSDPEPNSTIITDIQGDVQVMKAGESNWTAAQIKMILQSGDSIKTANNSAAVVTFFEGSTVKMEANTQIQVSKLSIPAATEKSTIINLKQQIGNTVNTVKKLTDSASRYEIETPAAVAGVGGSVMLVSVSRDGTTRVTNQEGNIYVVAAEVKIVIPMGNSSTVTPGQPPAAPIPAPSADAKLVGYSATASFSTTKGNPNGNWSYGWMPVDFSVFHIYAAHNSIQWYADLGSDLTPSIWLNSQGMAYGVPTGWLSLHPGPDKQPSLLRWTAPASGNIRVLGQFLAGDRGIMTVDIRHNNKEIWKATDSGSFDLTMRVAAQDTVDFAVFDGYGFGNTPVSVDIRYQD